MGLSFIQLISVTGAVILIIFILLVAALIGYLTAWFYAKSVYKPVIKGLEEEKARLIEQVAEAKEEINKLKIKAGELDNRIKELEEESKKKDEELKEIKNK